MMTTPVLPRRYLALFAGLLITTVIGCSNNNNNDDAGPVAQVRVLHASPDAPAVDVMLNGDRVLEDVGYQTGSRYFDVPLEEAEITVNLAGTDETVLEERDPLLVPDTRYTLIAANRVAEFEAILLEDRTLEPAEGNLKVRVVHAAPAAPEVDVYVTEPEVAVGDAEPVLQNLAFGDASDFLEIPAGDYRIRVTGTGSEEALYDSGPITLEEGLELTIAALETGAGTIAPITLIALTGDDEEPTLALADHRGQLRAAHLAPDAPAVDILVDGEAVLSGVTFTDVSDYLPLEAGEYAITVNAAEAGTPVISETIEIAPGDIFTLAAVGLLADTLEGLLLTDQLPALPEGEVHLRVVHASPDAGPVDIYVDGEAVLEEVMFQDASDYLTLEAGDYMVQVNLAGTETTVIEETLTLESRGIYTVFAAGTAEAITLIAVQDNEVPAEEDEDENGDEGGE